jgi:rod shape-determining protein MreD
MNRFHSPTLKPWSWIGAPLALSLLATILLAVPLRIGGLSLPEPVWPMLLAFAWPVIRPSIAAPLALLAAGLFLDLWWGASLGLWALSLLAVYAAALALRRLLVGQSGPILWAWYVGLTLVLFGVAHLLTMLDLRTSADPASVGLQALATAVLYPFAHRLIDTFEEAGSRIR